MFSPIIDSCDLQLFTLLLYNYFGEIKLTNLKTLYILDNAAVLFLVQQFEK